MAEPDRAQMTM